MKANGDGGLANEIARGLLAGLVGTAAMTVSSTLEAKLRGRPFSTAPAEAAAKVLGIKEFRSEAARSRFSNLVHWGYGTGWGAVRGLMRMSCRRVPSMAFILTGSSQNHCLL